MNIRKRVGLCSMALAIGLASCSHVTEPRRGETIVPETMTPCRAKIISVKKETWEWHTVGLAEKVIARGDWTIVLQFIAPPVYADRLRTLGAYQEADVIVDGRPLQAGDVISFSASESVLRQSVLPDVFTNFADVKRVK